MSTETGGMLPQDKECWQLPETGTGREAYQHNHVRSLASRTGRGYICVVLSYIVCGNLL